MWRLVAGMCRLGSFHDWYWLLGQATAERPPSVILSSCIMIRAVMGELHIIVTHQAHA
jgi:hypothetical protein